jgi:endonuclease YncB( thermonuclease family)
MDCLVAIEVAADLLLFRREGRYFMQKIVILMVVAVIAFLLLSGTDVYAKGKRSASEYKSYNGAKAIDGDTYRYKGERYRVRQYNSPELGKPGSVKATRNLQRKINSGNYKWKPVARDVYGRKIVQEKKIK